MIYIELFYKFFIVGLLSFGGAYSAVPLVREVARSFTSISDEMLADFIAISESTPGPIAVNLATFIGTEVAGLPGAIVATFAEILPAFIIILLFTLFFKHFLSNKRVQFVLSVIRPCVIGVVMSVGLYMIYENLKLNKILRFEVSDCNVLKALIIGVIILLFMFIYKKIAKKKLSTTKIIILGAIFGIAINFAL